MTQYLSTIERKHSSSNFQILSRDSEFRMWVHMPTQLGVLRQRRSNQIALEEKPAPDQSPSDCNIIFLNLLANQNAHALVGETITYYVRDPIFELIFPKIFNYLMCQIADVFINPSSRTIIQGKNHCFKGVKN